MAVVNPVDEPIVPEADATPSPSPVVDPALAALPPSSPMVEPAPLPVAEPQAPEEPATYEPEAGFIGDLWKAIRTGSQKAGPPIGFKALKPVARQPIKISAVPQAILDKLEITVPSTTRIKLRLSQIDNPYEVDRTLNVLAQEYKTVLDDAKRGVITDKELRSKVTQLGWSELDIMRWKNGEIMNAEKQLAANELLASASNKFIAYRDEMQQNGLWKTPEVRLQASSLIGGILELAKKSQGSLSEAGRTLRVPQIDITGIAEAKQLSTIARLMQENSALADPGMRAEDLWAAIDGIENPLKLSRMSNLWANTKGMFHEFYINSLLSGPVTQTANIIGNQLTLSTAILERYIAGTIGAMSSAPDRVRFGEGTQMISAIYSSIEDAWRSAAKVYRGEMVPLGSKLDTVSRGAWSVDQLGDGMFARFADTLGHYVVTQPSRILTAADQFNQVLAFRAGLRAEAYRLASQEGLTGTALFNEMDKIMMDPKTFESIHKGAQTFSDYVTFHRALGERGKTLLAARDALGPLGTVAFPFLKTPVNIMKHIGERLPGVNIGGALLDRAITGNSQALYADFMAGGARQQIALSKVASGSAAAALVWYWASNGWITGMGPTDPKLKAELEATGWQEYSIHIPGHGYLKYNRFDPIAGFVSAVTTLAQLSQGKNALDPSQMDDVAFSVLAAYADTFVSRSFVQGFSRLADTVTQLRKGDYEGGPMKFASQTIGGVVPNFFAQANRQWVDNRQTVVDNLLSRAASRTFGFSKDVRPLRDMWGEEKHYSSYPGVVGFILPVEYSKEKDDPAAAEIYRLGLAVPDIPKKLWGPSEKSVILDPNKAAALQDYGVKLTPAMQDDLSKLRGSVKNGGMTLHERIDHIINSPGYKSSTRTDGPLGTRAAEISAMFHAYEQIAEDRLLKLYPDLKGERERVMRHKGELKTQPLQAGEMQSIIERFGGKTQ